MIYTGRQSWTPARRVIDLVSPERDAEAERLDLSSRRSSLFAGDGYLLLDIDRLGRDDFDSDNVASLLAQLTNPRRDGTTAKLAGRLLDLLAGEDPGLSKVMFEWIRQESGLDLGVEEMETVRRLDRPARDDLFEERVVRWSDLLRAEGVQEGRAEARAEERGRLVHMAELKFGAMTAGRLERLLANMTDATELDEVGGCIITCQTGDDLLAQVAEGANGRE